MTLTELRYIVAVARERHFGRAAEACFVSQPTLSVAVRKLEAELGVTLFERGKGEVLVTATGERVVRQAGKVLEEANVLRQVAAAEQDELSSPLRLGAIHTIGPYLFPELIPILKERAPQMPLRIEEGFTHDLIELLRNGDLDVVLLALPCVEPGIETRALYDEPFVVLVPSAHPWSNLSRIRPQDLAGESVLLLGPGHCFRDQVIDLCPECAHAAGRTDAARTVEGSSLETIRHMVASGLGVTVLPCSSAGADRYSQRLVTIRRFADPVPTRRVALAWRRSFPRHRAIEVLAEAVQDVGFTCLTPLTESAAASA